MSYGVSRCRYAIVKEFVEGTREETLYIVAELPFFDDDNDMKLRADLLGAIAYKNHSDAVEDYQTRLTRDYQLII